MSRQRRGRREGPGPRPAGPDTHLRQRVWLGAGRGVAAVPLWAWWRRAGGCAGVAIFDFHLVVVLDEDQRRPLSAQGFLGLVRVADRLAATRDAQSQAAGRVRGWHVRGLRFPVVGRR